MGWHHPFHRRNELNWKSKSLLACNPIPGMTNSQFSTKMKRELIDVKSSTAQHNKNEESNIQASMHSVVFNLNAFQYISGLIERKGKPSLQLHISTKHTTTLNCCSSFFSRSCISSSFCFKAFSLAVSWCCCCFSFSTVSSISLLRKTISTAIQLYKMPPMFMVFSILSRCKFVKASWALYISKSMWQPKRQSAQRFLIA